MIIARFHPQAWINNHAVEVDPEGPVEWDVTEAIMVMGREQALNLRDDDYPSDELRFTENAPQWVREWSGPFWVEVADSIKAYFNPNPEGSTS